MRALLAASEAAGVGECRRCQVHGGERIGSRVTSHGLAVKLSQLSGLPAADPRYEAAGRGKLPSSLSVSGLAFDARPARRSS
jgi:hypothetical protein